MGMVWVMLAAAGIAAAGESHESAAVDITASLGEGTYVSAYAVVGAYATVGDGTVIGMRSTIASAAGPSTGTIIGIDAVVGRTVTIGSDVQVGDDSTLARASSVGSGARLGDQITVGYASTIAAGADLGTNVTIGSLASVGDAQIGDNVVIARGVVIEAGAVVESGVVLGPEVTVRAGATLRANVRVRKGTEIQADAVVETGARLGRSVIVASNAVIGVNATVRADSYIGTYQEVSGNVSRSTTLADLSPPDKVLIAGANGRTWSDGTVASSCAEYLIPPSGYLYSGEIGSGRYSVQPTGNIGAFEVYCDMAADGGGWTLVAKVDRHHGGAGMSEPNGWFGLGAVRNEAHLMDVTSRDSSSVLSTHGAARMGDMHAAGLTRARFTIIAENNTGQRATWFKAISDSTFLRWFSSSAHTSTQVCTNVGMTSNCSSGGILAGNVTVLDGMNLSQHGYPGSGAIHMRLDIDQSPSYSALCSSTSNDSGNAWNDTTSSHWGNGLEIWVR